MKNKFLISTLIIFTLLSTLCIHPILILQNNPSTTHSYRKNYLKSNEPPRGLFVKADNNLTRRQAIINFVAGLQMSDGGFVSTLDAPEEEEGIYKQTFQAVEILSILDGLSAINRDKLVEFLIRRQLDEGGFVPSLVYSKEKPDIVTTYSAVRILVHLDALDVINKTSLINWLLDCYHPEDGHFSEMSKEDDIEAYEHDYWAMSTAAGVLTLYYIDALSKIDVNKTINYIMSSYQSDGGFSYTPYDNYSNFLSTEWCLLALDKLNALDKIDREKTINFVMSNYDSEKQVFNISGTLLYDIYDGVFVLNLLNATDRVNRTRLTEIILDYQSNLHGGFVYTLNKSSRFYKEYLELTYVAVDALSRLQALDSLNTSFSVLYNPAWYGRPYIPHQTEGQDESLGYKIAADLYTIAFRLLILLGGIFIVFSVILIITKFYETKRLKKKEAG